MVVDEKESLEFQKDLLGKFFKECVVSDELQEKLKKEVNVIGQMDNEALIDAFEDLLRKGAGPGVFELIWMKREIMRRMDRGDMQ